MEKTKLVLNHSITNTDIVNLGDDYTICGTKYGVHWDGDLEEFLSDNDIQIGEDFKMYCELVENETDGRIEYLEEGEDVRLMTLHQGEKKFLVPTFAGKEGSSYLSENINFNKLIEI